MKSYSLRRLSLEELAAHGDFTHMAVITADDLTQTANNTSQAISIGTAKDQTIIGQVQIRLVTPFQNKSDAAFNSTTVTVGDTGSANRFITSQQVNANGTPITEPVYENTAYGPYTADTVLQVTFGSMSGKALNNLDIGELHVLVQILSTKGLSDSKAAALIAKQ